MTQRTTTEGLYCYVCGQQPAQEFTIFTLADRADRVFVGCIKCVARIDAEAKTTWVCTRSFYTDILHLLRRILRLVRFRSVEDYGDGSDWTECSGCRESWRITERHLPSCPIQTAKNVVKDLPA